MARSTCAGGPLAPAPNVAASATAIAAAPRASWLAGLAGRPGAVGRGGQSGQRGRTGRRTALTASRRGSAGFEPRGDHGGFILPAGRVQRPFYRRFGQPRAEAHEVSWSPAASTYRRRSRRVPLSGGWLTAA